MSAIELKSLNDKDLKSFLDSFDTVLTDCDGVIWLHDDPYPLAAEVLNTFRELGKRVFYVTNNSTKSQDDFVEKCKKLGFQASKNEILCTSNLAATYLKEQDIQKKVYIIGSTGISKELDKAGIEHCGVGPDPMGENVVYQNLQVDHDIGAVVVGFDPHFSFPKMVKAATYLRDNNVHFIGTNIDERFPSSSKLMIPGTGSFVRCIETCSGRKAVIMGKPEPYICDVLKKNFNVDPKRTLMIGDRANTDILLGKRCGFKTLLVLSGVTNLQELSQWKNSNDREEKELVPDFYTDAIQDLQPCLQKYKIQRNSD